MSNILFPINARRVKWDSTVEQDWDVNEQTSASGKSRTLTNQSLPGWVFTITFPALSSEERNKLFAFFTRVKGSAIPFFYKDAEDYNAEGVTLPQNTDGTYQLVAWMNGQQEPIYYADELKVYVDGTEQGSSTYTVSDGAVKFSTAPASTAKVTATYEYWWKVRFSKSKLQIKQRAKNLFQCQMSLKVVR